MTTIEDQKRMFYAAGRQATLKALSDFINKRSKERFEMVKAYHASGRREEDWAEIEKFDEETDKQEKILEAMARST